MVGQIAVVIGNFVRGFGEIDHRVWIVVLWLPALETPASFSYIVSRPDPAEVHRASDQGNLDCIHTTN